MGHAFFMGPCLCCAIDLRCLWQESTAFDGLVFACETAMAGSGVFTCLAAAKVGNGRDWKQRVRDTPIDIRLTPEPETRRLSADEIQINCKAVR